MRQILLSISPQIVPNVLTTDSRVGAQGSLLSELKRVIDRERGSDANFINLKHAN